MDDATPAPPAGTITPRIYGPRSFKDEFHYAKKKDEMERVLDKIEGIYGRLNLLGDGLPVNTGFCFGLLDPATNILVNSAIPTSAASPPSAARARRRRRRQTAAGDMSQRSLDGLAAFLTCLFPYLPDAEAWAYLDAAEADPLAAALVIIRRRGMREFGFCSAATVAAVETALRCAAVAARHPDPRRLVLGWKLLLSSHGLKLKEFVVSERCDSVAAHVLSSLMNSIDENEMSEPAAAARLEMKEPWQLAETRLDANPTVRELPPVRAAAKRKLLATIHGLYLQALARLPTAELRGRYHRSMLAGGHCYGPLDPVSNIIVNTVWYDRAFPAASRLVALQMVSTAGLRRAAARSLYGLMSFLCTRHPGLSPDQALQRLQAAGASLRAADPSYLPDAASGAAGVQEAYAAAAAAAFHPRPDAQKEFLGSPDAVSKLIKVASDDLHLQDGRLLSSQDLEVLSMALHQQRHDDEPAPEKVKKSVYYHLCRCSARFWEQHERVTGMVAAALDKFNQTAAADDQQFRLHIICAANESVSGPQYIASGETVADYNPCNPYKYIHTHINFLAVCEARPYDLPTLFFAECGKDGDDTCWCVPVVPQKPDAEQARCIYCEHEQIRIVHPVDGNFHGHDEFEKLFYPSDDRDPDYTNDRVIKNNSLDVDWVHDGVKGDAIYLNCFPDDADDDSDEDEFHIS